MKKALLVDDDYLVRSYLKMLPSWEKAGFVIGADVRDGEEALECLKKDEYDLIVTDIAMPLMDGIELIREIRKNDRDIYIIVLSCHDEFEYVKKAMKEGADEYVLKNTLNEDTLCRLLSETEEKISGKLQQSMENDKSAEYVNAGEGSQKFLFFNQVLAGTLTGEERERKRKQSGVRGIYQNSAVIVMKLEEAENPEDPWADIKREQYCLDFLQHFIQELQREESENDTQKDVIYLGRGVICCFVDLSGMYKNSLMYQKLMDIAAFTYKICKNESGNFKIGVSNIGIGADALRQGYQQARMMLKIGFYEDDSIIYYDPQKTISRNLPDAAQKVLDQAEKLRYGKKEEFLYLADRAVRAFKEELTESMIVIHWLRKAEQILLQEDFPETHTILNIRDVTEAVRMIADKMSVPEQPLITEDISKAVRIAAEYVSLHYKESIGLNDAAEAAGVNSTYLSYLFSQEMGVGFSGYLLNLRIKCAQKLLRESDLKIRQVAEKSGFNDYHYFSKVFKKMTGISAAQYRKENAE